MIFLTIVVFGWKSYQDLPINLMPDISYPTLTVRTEYEGAAPEDVEKLLTRPLEETLSIVSGMEEISSTSSAGLSEVVLEFTWGTDMPLAIQEVRDRLDLYEPPPDVTQKPIILRYDPTLDPVMRIAITAPNPSAASEGTHSAEEEQRLLMQIRDSAERQIKGDLEGETGIAEVDVQGGIEEEIQILVDSQRLNDLGLSIAAVSSALQAQNINYTGGRLVDGKTEFLVRTINEYPDVSAIPSTAIPNPNDPTGPTLRLRDVAEVVVGAKDRKAIVRIDGKEAVELAIYKWGDGNTVQVCNQLKDIFGFDREKSLMERMIESMQAQQASAPQSSMMQMPAQFLLARLGRELSEDQSLRAQLPDGAELTLISDQSRFIVAAVKEVQSTAVIGGLLALIILYFFLRELKATTIIGVAIPISVVATFVPMYMWDISLNIMSLGGLALGIGMLVDNSIVVLESIARCSEEGDGTVEAADRGTNEVASAVNASTLTTVCVFLPIAFVEGIAGQMFRDQALTVTFSLMASLLVAMYLIPMIASRVRTPASETQDVVWIVSAYRTARAEGRSSAEALMLIPWTGFMRSCDWVLETAESSYAPVIAGSRRVMHFRDSAAIRKMGGIAAMLLAGAILLLVGLFIVLQIMQGTAAAVTTTLSVLLVVVTLPLVLAILVIFLPFILVTFVFAVQAMLVFLQQFFVTMLFLSSAVVMGIVWAIGHLLWAILYIPLALFDRGFNAFRSGYIFALRRTLQLGPIVLVVVLALAVHAGMKAQTLGRELIPPLKQGEFGIRMEAPPGTQLEETERRARNIERIVMAVEEVGSVAVKIGQDDANEAGSEGENVAEFTVLLKNPDENSAIQDEIIQHLREMIAPMTSDEIMFTLPALFSFKTAVELQIRGEDLDVIRRAGLDLIERCQDIPGLKDLELNLREGYPEIVIEPDNDLLAAKGLTFDAIASKIQHELRGQVPTKLNRRGEKVDIRVQTNKQFLNSVKDLESLAISEGSPMIPLKSVATISVQPGPSEIRRVDQRRVGIITANVEGNDLGSVTAELLARSHSVILPPDYQIVAGGQNRELETSLSSLQFALLLAIFLVYVVMASQFESIWHPAIVMFSVPLAFVGVVHTLAIFEIDLSIVVYIGGIILAGIVVNNAIVLVDYVNQLRRRGMAKREAVIEAGRVRLRPILMTTITTVLGLVPMVMSSGEGAEIRQPMAITLMAGLTSATLLTLFVIPMVYDIFGGRDKA